MGCVKMYLKIYKIVLKFEVLCEQLIGNVMLNHYFVIKIWVVV